MILAKLFLKKTDNNECMITNYVPLTDDYLTVPDELLHPIPFENRFTMSFQQYQQDTEEQKELNNIGKKF